MNNKVDIYFESILKQFTEHCRRPCSIACASLKCNSSEEQRLNAKLRNHNIQMIVTEDETYIFVDGSKIIPIVIEELEGESEGESLAALVAYRMESELGANFSCVSLDMTKYLEGGVKNPEFENVVGILETKYNLHVAVLGDRVKLSIIKKLTIDSIELPTSLPSIAADYIIREFFRNERKVISLALVNLTDSVGMQRVTKTIDILRNNGIGAYVKGARLVVAPLPETVDVDSSGESEIVRPAVKHAMEHAAKALADARKAALDTADDLMERCKSSDHDDAESYIRAIDAIKRDRKAVKKAFKKMNKALEKVRTVEILKWT